MRGGRPGAAGNPGQARRVPARCSCSVPGGSCGGRSQARGEAAALLAGSHPGGGGHSSLFPPPPVPSPGSFPCSSHDSAVLGSAKLLRGVGREGGINGGALLSVGVAGTPPHSRLRHGGVPRNSSGTWFLPLVLYSAPRGHFWHIWGHFQLGIQLGTAAESPPRPVLQAPAEVTGQAEKQNGEFWGF